MRQLQAWDRRNAGAVVSTVHKAKGQEANHVKMLDDFQSLWDVIERLKQMVVSDTTSVGKFSQDSMTSAFDMSKIMEEFRLLYVAITRTLGTLDIPPEYVIDRQSIDLFQDMVQRAGVYQ
jgi:superfamily I DNA/RNA helicase